MPLTLSARCYWPPVGVLSLLLWTPLNFRWLITMRFTFTQRIFIKKTKKKRKELLWNLKCWFLLKLRRQLVNKPVKTKQPDWNMEQELMLFSHTPPSFICCRLMKDLYANSNRWSGNGWRRQWRSERFEVEIQRSCKQHHIMILVLDFSSH